MLTTKQVLAWLPAFSLACFGIGWSSIALGDFIDCQDIKTDGSYQIVVGDVGLRPGSNSLSRIRLHNRLRQQLAELSYLGWNVRDVRCEGHSPRRSDYTERIVEARYRYGVLVEVWGVSAESDAAVTYAVLPLLPPLRQSSAMPGFYQLGYQGIPGKDIVNVFAEAFELRAFTALSVGLRLLREAKRTHQNHDGAYATLCEADRLLHEAEERTGYSYITDRDWAALRALAKESAGAARAEAASISSIVSALTNPPAGVSIVGCIVPPPDPVP